MNKKILILVISYFYLFSNNLLAENIVIDPDNIYPIVRMETSMGNITIELDRIKAPITVNNFLTYVVTEEYDNTIFHRVIANFIVQGGGYDKNFTIKKVNKNIINEAGNGLKNVVGTIAMAKQSKPHTANRQFFFNVADNATLDPGRRWGYAVFGNIIEGQEVIDAIAKVQTHYSEEMAWNDVPVETIVLIKATLLPAE
jgi:peptidyl-prolyl cis-trans isomerase A (cyclophilin A)